jgi:GDP-mannose pyrophosphatase NudK
MIKDVKIVRTEILSDNWYVLKKVTFDLVKDDGSKVTQEREAYDRGNGAVILLYNASLHTVILIRQFRLPAYLNGNDSGMMIEACAGLLDDDSPEECIRRETEEETGYKINNVKNIFKAFMSPGAVTEILYFFIGEYTSDMKVSEGGGLAVEEENIEVLEIDYDQALGMISSGEIADAKTIMLLQYLRLHQIL